jgi:hypothetical protein
MALVYCGEHKYFYRSFREGRKVRREYLGYGAVAEALALLDQLEKERRQAAADAAEKRWRRELASLEQFERKILNYSGSVDSVMMWSLIKLGYYNHKRSWRPRLMTPERRAEFEREYHDFWNRAAAGDPGTVEQLRRHFDAAPEPYIDLFSGDLAKRVVDAILDRVAGRNLPEREAIRRKAEEHRKELSGSFPSTLESILAERCAVLYLATYEADLFMYRNMELLSSKRANFHERRRDRANRRYLSALKALALIREKLALAEERRSRAANAKSGRLNSGSRFDGRISLTN